MLEVDGALLKGKYGNMVTALIRKKILFEMVALKELGEETRAFGYLNTLQIDFRREECIRINLYAEGFEPYHLHLWREDVSLNFNSAYHVISNDMDFNYCLNISSLRNIILKLLYEERVDFRKLDRQVFRFLIPIP